MALDIFKNFKEHSIAEFFRKNKQMLGFSGKIRSLTTIVHEYVTNSLDACEEAQILPEIDVQILEEGEFYKVIVKDNGPGIPRKHLGKALGQMLAGTKFHRYIQQRGQQGIGAAGCTLFAQLTTGKPIFVISNYENQTIKCNISIDVRTNRPIISNEIIEENKDGSHGLYIEGIFGDVKYDKSSQSPYEYIKRTALSNPHLTISILEPSGQRTTFSRSTDRIPPKPQEVLPHPLGLTIADLFEMAHNQKEHSTLKAFLLNSFQRISAQKVEEIQKLTNGTVSGIRFVDLLKDPAQLTWEEAEALIKAFSNIKWIAPSSDCLRPIGAQRIQSSLANILSPDFIVVSERPSKIYKGGIPFLVEAALAWGGKAGRLLQNSEVTYDVIRYANSAPLLFDSYACAISQAVKEIDWKRYQIKDIEHSPLTIFVNFVSVHVPYISTGKQAISPEEEIYQEIKYALMDCARKLQSYISGVNREKEIQSRKNVILRYVSQVSHDLAELSDIAKAEEIEKKLKEHVESKYLTKLLAE
ncbi:MAG: DNA topoisomerase VI subunit B [Candidatus Micrarchaeota archaeon]|nr:DNA topoisomerase VI subunit B [Candidatus Micrarchaeota archaeon]